MGHRQRVSERLGREVQLCAVQQGRERLSWMAQQVSALAGHDSLSFLSMTM